MGGWHDLAACRGTPLSVFFPPEIDAGDSWTAHGWNDTEAKTLCAGCPVQAWCLAWALDHNIHAGVFGGLNLGSRTDRRLNEDGRWLVCTDTDAIVAADGHLEQVLAETGGGTVVDLRPADVGGVA